MKHLVTYDLPADPAGNKRRYQLTKILGGHGLRVQLSVFELDIPPASLHTLVAQMEMVIDPEHDSVRIYPLCGTCSNKMLHLGQTCYIEHQEYYEF